MILSYDYNTYNISFILKKSIFKPSIIINEYIEFIRPIHGYPWPIIYSGVI